MNVIVLYSADTSMLFEKLSVLFFPLPDFT